MGKKGSDAMGEKEDGAQRKGDRRRVEAETDRPTEPQHMERQQNGKELTNEWNQTKGGEVLD